MMSCTPRRAFANFVAPMVRGMDSLLRAVNRSGTVERVVLTSSIAAVVADWEERGPGHVYTETDWPLSFGTHFAYGM
jgi:hypothetical protein